MPVDVRATKETKALLANLKRCSEKGVLFGHQDDLAYGVHWKAEAGRSDVKESCGDYPALYGWDVSGLGTAYNIDSVRFDNMATWIKEGYSRGGVITISWHMKNPQTNGNSWDTTSVVHELVPGGTLHKAYKKKLDLFVAFVDELKSNDSKEVDIPIIFRPFHENTGSWFWWGKGHTTAKDYIALWRFTVHYLRDVKGLHNVLYAYSTDRFDTKAEYLAFYPGDEYVDVLGFDDYWNIKNKENIPTFISSAKILIQLSKEKNKICALTETGVESVPDSTYWTDVLLDAFKSYPEATRIAYIMFWRNNDEKHHYAPYHGHPSEASFRVFKNDPLTIFESDLPDMYSMPEGLNK